MTAAPADDSWTLAIHASEADWTPLGTGVLIDERRVLTCAHVVRGRTVEAGLWVAFAKVNTATRRWRVVDVTGVAGLPDRVADVVVLTLEAAAPLGAEPAPLRDPGGADLVGTSWWAFGFPNQDVFGSAAYGQVGANLAYGWARLDTDSRYLVEPGFSGAGLWSAEYEAVVGLVGQARLADDRPGGNAGDGRALTLRQIGEWLPEQKFDRLSRWEIKVSGESALAAWGWALTDDPEAGRHWRPRSRGVSVDSEQGYRFRGRSAALAKIVEWLGRPDPDKRALVVTGSPGVGKSAVLGRVVTTADAGIRDALPADDDAVKAEVGSVGCAVHAKGKTALEVAAEIARAASVALPERLADLAPALRETLGGGAANGRRFNVVIDALDEASSPEEARGIITGIAIPLVQTCAAAGVQVVLGSRRRDDGGDLLGPFGDAVQIIDLDERAYFEDDDLRAYALATLQLVGAERPGNPYEEESVAEPVATRIADLADRNFLVAGLIARSHGMHDETPVAVGEIAFEATVAAALRTYLGRLAPIGAAPASTILTVLAFAEAPGLPLTLWLDGVRAFGAEITAEELTRFTHSAAANFLVEASTGGSGRWYRLFHQALNDALLSQRRAVRNIVADEHMLTDVWHRHGQRVGWANAPGYLLRSLPTHAAAAGAVDTLLGDDDYLRHADLRRLAPLAHRATTAHGRQRARMLHLTPHALSAEPVMRSAMFNVTTVLEQLDPFPPDNGAPFRGVWATAVPRGERSTLAGHAGTVNAVCVVPVPGRGWMLASGGDDGTVRLWEPETGRAGHTLTGHTGRVMAVCAVPTAGGHLLASGGEDGVVVIWDPATGRTSALLRGHDGPVTAVCAVPVDGGYLVATGSEDRTVRFWDPETGQTRAVLTGHADIVTSLCAVRAGDAGHLVASGSYDRTVRLWDPRTGRLHAVLEGHSSSVVAVCAIAAGDEDLLASAGFQGVIRLWNPRKASAAGSLTGDFGRVYAMCAVPVAGRQLLATATFDENVRLWDPHENRIERTFAGHTGPVTALCAVPVVDAPGHLVASGSTDRTVRLWDPNALETGKAPGGTERVNAVCAVSVAGRQLVAAAGADWSVNLVDAGTGVRARTFGSGGPHNGICTFRGIKGRQLLAVGGNSTDVHVFDLVDGTEWTIGRHEGRVRAVCAVPVDDGLELLASASGDTVTLSSVTQRPSRRRTVLTGHSDRVQAVCAIPFGSSHLVASGSDDETVRLWDPDTGALVRTLTGHSGWVNAVCAVPVGEEHLLASAGNDLAVRLWNLRTGQLHTILTGHTDRVRALCTVHVGGRTALASASDDQTVKLWDPESGTLLQTIHAHHPATSCAEVDGNVVIGLSVGLLAVRL